MNNTQVVTEFAGRYGNVSFLELVFQQIWKEAATVDRVFFTEEGQSIRVLDGGDWNRLEGPDFRNAEIEVGGERRFGDIEVHLDASDWAMHHHDKDANYRRVILHVYLFDSRHGGNDRKELPMAHLCFLPYLEQDIEAYAEEMDLRASMPSRWKTVADPEEMAGLAIEEKRAWAVNASHERWVMKKRFAALRFTRLSEKAAWHESVLDALGYRRNRRAMYQIAQTFPLPCWRVKDFSVEQAFQSQSSLWKLRGQRPANHPLKRMKQYHQVCLQNPEWWKDLQTLSLLDMSSLMESLSNIPIAQLRETMRTSSLRKEIQAIFANEWNGTFLDTLIVDVVLPVCSILHVQDYFPLWFIWYSGNFPEKWKQEIMETKLIDGRQYPAANGWNQAWITTKS